MDLPEPQPKKSKRKYSSPLPLIKTDSGEFYKFKGVFNEFSVIVEDEEEMKKLTRMGFFGKANLSRCYPSFKFHTPEVVCDRVYKTRKFWAGLSPKEPQKVLVIPHKDCKKKRKINYLSYVNPVEKDDCSGFKESVHLDLEEAFFLLSALKCLNIFYDNRLLSIEETWELFKQSNKFFLINYVAYYHFRTKNWVVKTGLKYGGEFVLYKQGPEYYHASYLVVVRALDENLEEIKKYRRRSMLVGPLVDLNRVAESSGKELLICDIICPNNSENLSYDNLSAFTVREMLMRRWIIVKEREPGDIN